MPDRPAPVVTVSVPGRAGPGDLLGADPPPGLPASRAQRGLVTAAAVVLLAGLVVVTGEQVDPVPAAADPVAETPPPSVTARPTDAGVGVGGPGDSQSPSVDDEVTLLGLTAQGFELRLAGVDGPFSLGPSGREGVSGELDVAVTDCSLPTQAQRLDRLVARTCRRPRG